MTAEDWAEVPLAPELSNNPEHQRKQRAEDKAGYQWKVNHAVLAAPGNVAGKASERQVQFSRRQQRDSQRYQQRTQADQRLPQLVHE